MFGRFDQVDDKPDWREKLDEWRASPVWVPKRPDWLGESPSALLALFVGLALVMASVVYLVVPAEALPEPIPGRWTAPPTSATVSTTTTTIATPSRESLSRLHVINAESPEKKRQALKYMKFLADSKRHQAEIDAVVNSPAVPPSRRWAYAFVAAVAGAGLLALAWVLSDTRRRIQFHK